MKVKEKKKGSFWKLSEKSGDLDFFFDFFEIWRNLGPFFCEKYCA
jgi:hypothetical protein